MKNKTTIEEISIALESAPVHVDINQVTRTVRRVKNVGFCLEDYNALEYAYPGIFKEINPRMLTLEPSATKQAVAVELLGKVAIGVTVVGVFYKLISWAIDKLSGMNGTATGNGVSAIKLKDVNELQNDHKETVASVADEVKRIKKEVPNPASATDANIADIKDHILNDKFLATTLGTICANRVGKNTDVLNEINSAIGFADNASVKLEPQVVYALCNKTGVSGIAVVFNSRETSALKLSTLPRLAVSLAKAIIEGDKFIASQNVITLNNFLNAVSSCKANNKTLGLTDTIKGAITDSKSDRYSIYSKVLKDCIDHKAHDRADFHKVSMTDDVRLDRSCLASTARDTILESSTTLKNMKSTDMNGDLASIFKKSVGELQTIFTDVMFVIETITQETSAVYKINDDYVKALSKLKGDK